MDWVTGGQKETMTDRSVPTGLIGGFALLLSLVGVFLWVTMLAGPVKLTTGLLDARTHLNRAQKSLEKTQFKSASFETYAAQASIARAQAGFNSSSPLMDLATLSPQVNDASKELPHILNAVSHAADAAEGTLDVGLGSLRGPNKVVSPDPDDEGRSIIRIERVEALGETLGQIRADIAAAAGEFEAIDLDNLPRRLHGEVNDGIEQAESTDELLARAEAGFELLPSILGKDEPRTYIIGFQNSAELRGSGGALLQFEFLTIDDGRPELAGNEKGSVGSVYKLDQDRRTVDIPLPQDAWYVREIMDAQRFGNFNWSPDWPLDAQLGVAYGKRSAELCVPGGDNECPEFPDVDGMIAVDPVMVENLMPGVGPFQPRKAFFVTRSTVIDVLLSKAYAVYPIPSDRRQFLGDLVSKFFQRMFSPSQPTELVKGIGDSLATKHMQIWMADEAEQAFVKRMNWDGAIEKAPRSDYLYVVEQNVGGNKLNYSATQTNEVDVTLGEDGGADVSAEVTIANDVRLPQPRWVLGDSKSVHRPMLNVYVPQRAQLVGAGAGQACPLGPPLSFECNGRLDTPTPAVWSSGLPPEHSERGKKVWSATLQVPAQQEGSFSLDYRLPGAVQERGDRRVYRLVLQRQPKVTPENLVVRVVVPAGARSIDAPGFERDGDTLVYERPLTKDTVLEVSWRG